MIAVAPRARSTRTASTRAMLILAIVALVAEYLITRLENRLLRWRPRRRDDFASHI